MKLVASTLLLLLLTLAHAADIAPLTLTGNWDGTWADSRPEYTKSGGNFSCIAVEKSPLVWTCSFALGKTRTWVVELKGKRENGKLIFGATTSLGDVQGLYTWKGVLAADGFNGEYDGPDEKGTFKMTRPAADAEKKE
jgi:hypothetical protein